MAALLWLALSPTAMAQGGGYPASPSHAVVGTTADGTPRYGREPRKEQGASDTVGRGGAFDSSGKQDRTPEASNRADDRQRTTSGPQERGK